eukprot:m.47264 g.47264  ORF g.47264 m.47264 type:complete len:799 (+) comp33773_c0_seq3:171-2567(+)
MSLLSISRHHSPFRSPGVALLRPNNARTTQRRIRLICSMFEALGAQLGRFRLKNGIVSSGGDFTGGDKEEKKGEIPSDSYSGRLANGVILPAVDDWESMRTGDDGDDDDVHRMRTTAVAAAAATTSLLSPLQMRFRLGKCVDDAERELERVSSVARQLPVVGVNLARSAQTAIELFRCQMKEIAVQLAKRTEEVIQGIEARRQRLTRLVEDRLTGTCQEKRQLEEAVRLARECLNQTDDELLLERYDALVESLSDQQTSCKCHCQVPDDPITLGVIVDSEVLAAIKSEIQRLGAVQGECADLEGCKLCRFDPRQSHAARTRSTSPLSPSVLSSTPSPIFRRKRTSHPSTANQAKSSKSTHKATLSFDPTDDSSEASDAPPPPPPEDDDRMQERKLTARKSTQSPCQPLPPPLPLKSANGLTDDNFKTLLLTSGEECGDGMASASAPVGSNGVSIAVRNSSTGHSHGDGDASDSSMSIQIRTTADRATSTKRLARKSIHSVNPSEVDNSCLARDVAVDVSELDVHHKCTNTDGIFGLERYYKPMHPCILCCKCQRLYSPCEFIMHSHDDDAKVCVSRKWRHCVRLSESSVNNEQHRAAFIRAKERFGHQSPKTTPEQTRKQLKHPLSTEKSDKPRKRRSMDSAELLPYYTFVDKSEDLYRFEPRFGKPYAGPNASAAEKPQRGELVCVVPSICEYNGQPWIGQCQRLMEKDGQDFIEVRWLRGAYTQPWTFDTRKRFGTGAVPLESVAFWGFTLKWNGRLRKQTVDGIRQELEEDDVPSRQIRGGAATGAIQLPEKSST